MEAKKRLAESIAAMYHSAEEARRKPLRAAWEAQFSRRGADRHADRPGERGSRRSRLISGLIKQAGLATGTNDAAKMAATAA